MDPYADDLLADTLTRKIGPFPGGGIGALPKPLVAPADVAPSYGALQTPFFAYLRDIIVSGLRRRADAFLRVSPPPPAPADFAPGCGVAAANVELPAPYDDARAPNAFHTKFAVDAPRRRLPPPPGFAPLPAPVRADSVYATPVGEGHKLKTFREIPTWSNPVQPRLTPRPAPAAPVSNDSATSRPQLCPPYDDEIDANLRTLEKNAAERPSPDYLKKVHRDQISPLTRAKLVLWMDKFTQDYDLAPGTLHRAVSYVDRVLSVRVLRSYIGYTLLLLGATAVYTAAKYESRSTTLKLNATKVAIYCGFTEGKEAILVMERAMLQALDYQLGGPTAETFVAQFTRYSQGEKELKVQQLAYDFADKSLLNYGCLGYLPSVVAATSIFKARYKLNPPDEQPWSSELEELTRYSLHHLVQCACTMMNLL
ncbi:hypothetical protein ABZP36_032245 [Zizania latifolia]